MNELKFKDLEVNSYYKCNTPRGVKNVVVLAATEQKCLISMDMPSNNPFSIETDLLLSWINSSLKTQEGQ